MALFRRSKASSNATTALLVLTDSGVTRVNTGSYGTDLVQEVAKLLRSENIRSTRLADNLTLWHAELSPGQAQPGVPNPAASRLAAEHGHPPVSGPAVVTGAQLYGSPYPLDADETDRLAARLRG
ncbi:hypothetical protein ACWDYK_08230 [Streptomyces anthocyanicus]|uniref:hypothetical protein n=1 Tax=Streptomyces anthocyanicus TaxID=68174 RepID=UPI002F911F42|nr:hypothetical protein OHA15_40830 [Streptomyces anthocyanicus]